MGIVDNIKKRMAGAQDQVDYDDAYADDGYYADKFGSYDEPEDTDAGMTAQAPIGGMGAGISLSGSSGSALEMKVVKPESFDSVAQIADHLISRRTVVLNLENTNKETARRLIDFLSGVAYSIDGQLKRVANNTFVITPHNVDVSGDQLRGPEPKPEPKSPIDEDDIYSSEL